MLISYGHIKCCDCSLYHWPSHYNKDQQREDLTQQQQTWRSPLPQCIVDSASLQIRRRPISHTDLGNTRCRDRLLEFEDKRRPLFERCTCGQYATDAKLQALCSSGEVSKALDLLLSKECSATTPSYRTYLSLLKACRDLRLAKLLYAHLIQHSPSHVGSLGHQLISTFIQCGAFQDTRQLFMSLPFRNVVAWTAMISGYVENGQALEALKMHQSMEEEGVEPDTYLFVSLFKACSIVGNLEKGRQLHANAQSKGLVSNIFVGNSLLSMYGKCGSIIEAEEVFQELSERDVVSWNTMISVYMEQGQEDRSLKLYRQMKEEGVSVSKQTYIITIQACGAFAEKEGSLVMEGGPKKLTSLDIGQGLHADVKKSNVDLDVFLHGALVTMYGKCGSLVEAEVTFIHSPCCNPVLWTLLASVYVEHGQADKALLWYRQMRQEGMSIDQQMLLITVQACSILADKEKMAIIDDSQLVSLQIGQALHSDAEMGGFTVDVFVASAFMNMYGKCGAILQAEDMFTKMPWHDAVSWSAMLSAYVEDGHGDTALLLYRQMQEEGVCLDEQILVITLQACNSLLEEEGALGLEVSCSKQAVLEIGLALHADARRVSFTSNTFVCNALVSLYGKCGRIEEAESVFQALSQKSIVSYNAMLSAYVEQGLSDKALQLYTQIGDKDMVPNDNTLVSVLQACGGIGSPEICHVLHFTLVSAGYDSSPHLANTLVHAYGDCASMEDAWSIFDKLPQRDIVSWNACIAGYAREGNVQASLHMFECMQLADVKPDAVSFLLVLSVCSHAGLVDLGYGYFESMRRDHGLCPSLKHHSVILDLLGRAGDFTRVERILSTMPRHADASILIGLLGACYRHGNLALGKYAFDCAVQLQPKESRAYILMSNIFAEDGCQELAEDVEEKRCI